METKYREAAGRVGELLKEKWEIEEKGGFLEDSYVLLRRRGEG